MNYLHYVIAAYAVFGIVMAWDYVAPRIAMRQQLRAARALAARLHAQRAQGSATDTRSPLSRD